MSNNLTTPKVSVIMPVYNSKQFLPEAIESVLKQSMSDFELILVNDGSTDGSAEVCDKYADTDGRIRVIHKKNGGVCSARNVGIDASRSEYVTFIDNDDYYDTDFLEVLFSGIISENADLAKCGRKNIRITPENKILKETENTYLDVCLDKEEFSEQYIRIKLSGIYSSIWNGLYRKSILVENNVRFDENVVHGNEDIIFNSEYSLYCSRFLFVRKSLYTHFYRIGHSTSTKFYDDQVSTRIQALNMEMNLTQNEESKNIIALEGIRECFRLLLPIKEHKKRLEYIDYIKRNMDFNVLKKNKILSADLLSKAAKVDLILIKNRAYRLYFSLRKLMA